MQSNTTKALRAATPDAPPGGIAHLAHAINTTPDAAITPEMRAGAAETARKVDAATPVPTNERQAGELQKYGVWNPLTSSWIVCDRRTAFSREDAEAIASNCHKNCEVRPAPAPTPPAAPGEWKVLLIGQDEYRVNKYAVSGSRKTWGPFDIDEANALATRLNRADAMERALKEVVRLLDYTPENVADMDSDRLVIDARRAAKAALRK